MSKKYLSLVLVAILAASSLSIAADASVVEAKESNDATGTIKFDMGSWNHEDQVCFYIWDSTNGQFASNKGWTSTNAWGSKKLLGTPVEGQDGIVESYEITIPEDHNVFVIFHDKTTGEQTYDCVLTPDAIGDTAYMTGVMFENPADSEKQAIEAKFKNTAASGPYLQVTSTGNIVGNTKAPNDDPAEKVANYVLNGYGVKDKSGVDVCTKEKLTAAIEVFGTNVDDVVAAYEKNSESEKYNAEAIEFIKSAAPVAPEPDPEPDPQPQPDPKPDPQPSVDPVIKTGTIKFDMGDWDHTDQVCFYIWDSTSGEFASNKGWTTTNAWGSKKLLGTPVEGEDGIVESYEVTVRSDHNIFVIFHDKTTSEQTYDCVLTPDAIGDTAYMTGVMLENPADSEKQAIEAKFKNTAASGPYLQVTSTGNIVGDTKAPNDDPAEKVANYVLNGYGVQDKSGVDVCTKEKLEAAMTAFNVTTDEVLAAYEKNSESEKYSAEAVEFIKSAAPQVDPQPQPDPEPKPEPDPEPQPKTAKLGDADGDEAITAADSLKVLRASVKLEEVDTKIADVDGDEAVTSGDALFVLQTSVGIKTPYAIGEDVQ